MNSVNNSGTSSEVCQKPIIYYIVGGNFNGHAGERRSEVGKIHGGKGMGMRNIDGERSGQYGRSARFSDIPYLLREETTPEDHVQQWTSRNRDHVLPSEARPPVAGSIPKWMLEGVRTILKKLKKGKAVGPDNIPSELLWTIPKHLILWNRM
ncbi:hypothetical protein ANCDUO_15281 [Ancylostoma duodenale]|uniref:Reverse transcriptase domain-containing protein n=1 Tax=Ancylostoma duodenale TaxID=51022 RepID=A0A0C2CXJ7_9BILA|nr:hypothetical protein ANCDUO_15281 [Ancylostoma duodenale]